MLDALQDFLSAMSASVDGRTSVFDLRILHAGEGSLSLAGRLLDPAQLESLARALAERFPGLTVDTAEIKVLEQVDLPRVHVATNLTGLYERPAFGGPLASELYYGTDLQVLEEVDRWVFVRQRDGYLGWAYRPYLVEGLAPEPTHLVMAPSVELLVQPGLRGSIVTRLVSGTGVVVEETDSRWVFVAANKKGWLPARFLRSVKEYPATAERQRARIVKDAEGMIGTPYLWGGMSGNGIDCSGLARLLHRWIGIEIPRDADMQWAAAKPVEPPLKPGDLLFFAEGDRPKHISHVGISLGGWKLIHSSRSRNGVYVDDLDEADYLREIYMSAGSFIH